jgi:dihydropteroate synthase
LIGSNEIRDRLAPAVALTALLRARDMNVFRVHDVKEHANALRVAEAVLMQ